MRQRTIYEPAIKGLKAAFVRDPQRRSHIGILSKLLPIWERSILASVRIIARRTLRKFWERHPEAEQSLRAWYYDARRAAWRSPTDIKRTYANTSIIGRNRVVFNIKGNRYRLVVAINYAYQICYIRFVGTHQAYDQIDAEWV